MNINELLATTQALKDAGFGDWPVEVMEVDAGITYSHPVSQVIQGDPYDGKRIWVITSERQDPEWMHKK